MKAFVIWRWLGIPRRPGRHIKSEHSHATAKRLCPRGLVAPRDELLARRVVLALDCPSLEVGTDPRDDLSALLGPKQRLPPADEIAPRLVPLLVRAPHLRGVAGLADSIFSWSVATAA